jgi:hypothetical protein
MNWSDDNNRHWKTMVMSDDHEIRRSPWAKSEAIAIPDAPANNPMGFFESVRAQRRSSYSREEWGKVHLVCTPMVHKTNGSNAYAR